MSIFHPRQPTTLKVGTPSLAFPIAVASGFGQSSAPTRTSPFLARMFKGCVGRDKHFFLLFFFFFFVLLIGSRRSTSRRGGCGCFEKERSKASKREMKMAKLTQEGRESLNSPILENVEIGETFLTILLLLLLLLGCRLCAVG